MAYQIFNKPDPAHHPIPIIEITDVQTNRKYYPVTYINKVRSPNNSESIFEEILENIRTLIV
ncbi:hypothetical protein ACFL96_00175 [Thermoproteota archaeon]